MTVEMVIKRLYFATAKKRGNCTFRFEKLYVSFSRLYLAVPKSSMSFHVWEPQMTAARERSTMLSAVCILQRSILGSIVTIELANSFKLSGVIVILSIPSFRLSLCCKYINNQQNKQIAQGVCFYFWVFVLIFYNRVFPVAFMHDFLIGQRRQHAGVCIRAIRFPVRTSPLFAFNRYFCKVRDGRLCARNN